MVHTIKLFRLKVHKLQSQLSTTKKIWIQFCSWEFMLTFKQPIIITFLQIFQDTCSKFPESKLDNYLLQRDGNRSSIIKFTIFVTWCNFFLQFRNVHLHLRKYENSECLTKFDKVFLQQRILSFAVALHCCCHWSWTKPKCRPCECKRQNTDSSRVSVASGSAEEALWRQLQAL